MTISRDDIANGIVEGRRLRAQAVRNTLGRVRTYFSDPRP